MRKNVFLLVALFFCITGVSAQNWSAVLDAFSGLPGVKTQTTAGEIYKFVSPVYDLGSSTTKTIRLTVLDTYNHEQPNGNNYCFALSDLVVYDGNGNKIAYTASSNADHNSLNWTPDGAGLQGLSDGDYGTYFHSMWSSFYPIADYHYVEVELAKSVSSFSLEWATRAQQPKNSPIEVALTLGTDYVKPVVGEEFVLGEEVSAVGHLSQKNKVFVLKSNSQTSFTTADGVYYSGSGPIYMECAENGSTVASYKTIVQFIPLGSSQYFVYFPVEKKFLKDCGAEYNGANGWQMSTDDMNSAASVKLRRLPSGFFEMYYITTYNNSAGDTYTDTLYIAAELRDGVASKMKTFAPEKKAALEQGDYTQGYGLPAAFNWSIYKAELSEETIASVYMTKAQVATFYLSTPVRQAGEYLLEYGDFGGNADASVIEALETAIATAEGYMATGASPTMTQIKAALADVQQATSGYVALQLDVYEARIDSILASSTFSTYPYVSNTYPETSRTLLENIKKTVEQTKTKTNIYTPEQLAAIYQQIEKDIEQFYSTKITYNTLPITYGSADGLPGDEYFYGGCVWESPAIKLGDAVEGVRLTFTSTNTPSQLYSGYPVVALAEFELYDENGKFVTLSAANFATNSQEGTEGPIGNLCDDDITNFWHSVWKQGVFSPKGYVYLDITFPAPMRAFSFKLYGRDNGQLSPASVEVSLPSAGDDGVPGGDMLFVYLADGGVDAYSVSDMDGDYYTQGGYTYFPLTDGDIITYANQEIDSVSAVQPELPKFTSYKFNNKYNPNLNVDVVADTIISDMTFSLNSIGKWLTASFQLSDDRAVAYVDTTLQESKVTRQSFADTKTYTVTYPGYNKVGSVKVQDEVWGYTGDSEYVVPLKASMLSTNKPSHLSNESVASLLDGSSSTIYHSTWGTANNATINVDPFIAIALPTSLENIKLYYQCRPQNNYAPLELEIYASNDSANWTLVRTLTTADGLPKGSTAYATYTSPAIPLGGSYSYLKILQTDGEYSKNHMALAEMRIYDVLPGDSTLISEAVYETKRVPFGRKYNVDVNWLVDNAVSVPRIDIDIEGGKTVTSKDYYLNANFRITGYGVYDDFEDSVQIKGRGNTTWSYSKKPYRLKFEAKVKPFGLTKGKSWVLLANAQSGSMMANAAAMKIGQMAGAQFTNHIIPVELYINGVYKGNYMFTEKVGLANNSVDVSEDFGYLLELDTYYDEAYKFRSGRYGLPVNVKEPDLSEYMTDYATSRFNLIKEDFNKLDLELYAGRSINDLVDFDALARFMLVNDLVCNQEIGHPKSTFLFKEELDNPESKIKFGPVWDFDWAFGYEGTRNYCTASSKTSLFSYNMMNEPGYNFFLDLMRNENVQKHYYKVWTEFLSKNSIEELCDYLDCYYNFAKTSFENNSYVWSDGRDYDAINSRMQSWLAERSAYLYDNLAVYNLDEFNYPLVGDVNKNNLLTIHDLAITTAYNNGNTHPSFTYEKADTDGNGVITTDDITAIEAEVLNAEFLNATQYYNVPLAIGEVQVDDFAVTPNEDCNLPIKILRGGNENYKAVQMDVILPDGFIMFDATAGTAAANHTVALTQRDMTTYRIVVYSNTDELFGTGDDVVLNLVLTNYVEIAEEDCKVVVTNILAVDEATDELRMNEVTAKFVFGAAGLLGDVDNDGIVDVADVTRLIAIILGVETEIPDADIDGDNIVDVADVTRLIAIILGGDGASAAPARAAATRAAATSAITAEGEAGRLLVGITNPGYAFSAVQFDLYLPDGIAVETVQLGSRTSDHEAPACQVQADGAMRVVIASMSNSLFGGTEGDVAAINLAVDGAEDGDYEFQIKKAVISQAGSKEVLDGYRGSLTVSGGTTHIGSIAADASVADGVIYDLQGRKVTKTIKNSVYIKDNKKYIAE